ncbi:8844_t:CDS:1, partial [Dentiscutata erythropus]
TFTEVYNNLTSLFPTDIVSVPPPFDYTLVNPSACITMVLNYMRAAQQSQNRHNILAY